MASLLVLGCSTSAATTGGTSSSSSSSGAGGSVPQCGPGPYVKLHVGAVSYTTHLPIVGAKGTFDACPDQTFVSDNTGFFDAEITKGLAVEPRFEADGFIPTLGGQAILTGDLELGATALFPTSTMSWFPHLTPTTTDLLIISVLPLGTKADPTMPCTTRDGITYSVVGHPEAVITYYAGTSMAPVLDPTLKMTTQMGAAEVSGLAPTSGPTIELSSVKAGCSISFASYPHTGKYSLANGVLTLAGAFMPPVTSP